MSVTATSWILSEGYAGLQAQALGLAEAAGLQPELRVLRRARPGNGSPQRSGRRRWLPCRRGAGAAAGAGDRLRRHGRRGRCRAAARGRPVVQVQHPRMDPSRFDLVVVNRHDELTGPNVVVTRTALHRVTPARLAEAAADLGGRASRICRGRWSRCWSAAATAASGWMRAVARGLAGAARRDDAARPGRVALTPSRRTDPGRDRARRRRSAPLGGWVWDGAGDNPYFGMLALADAIVVTEDSVSMVSEAVATRAPVMLAALPGRSRRNRPVHRGLIADGRVRPFAGRLETVAGGSRSNDTPAAAAEMRRRLGF